MANLLPPSQKLEDVLAPRRGRTCSSVMTQHY